ncbi:hypothetical protein EXS70_00840 [Candidatus Peribacteria bacterium]|nr:hypothetical protein [Candidatus Peribacteria bacterium]
MPAIPERVAEKKPAVQQTSSWLQKTLRALFVGSAMAVSAVGYLAYRSSGESTEAVDIGNLFSTSPDGDIVGKELVFVDDETGERYRATFFMDAENLWVEINGETFSGRDSIRPFVTKIRKSGQMIVADLMTESTVEVPSQMVCTIGKAAKTAESNTITIFSAYRLRGPICLVPGIRTKGVQVVPLVRMLKSEERPIQ